MSKVSFKSLICSLLILFPLLVFGSAVHIIPVLLDLEAGEKNTSFKVFNESDEPMLFQMSAVTWTQEDGKDIQRETKDLILNPPIVKIEPNGFQLVRLGLRAPLNPQVEHTYRIFVTQVPTKTDEDKKMGVNTVLRFSLPLFIAPKKEKKDLIIEAQALPDGKLEFDVHNKGNVSIKLTKIDFMQGENPEPIASDNILSYVMPGQTKTLSLPTKDLKDNKDIVLKLDTDWGLQEVPVKAPYENVPR